MMSDVQIKRAVRDRDGNKCVDCGITAEDYYEAYQKSLDVHRIVPGSDYAFDSNCVTLCRPCHRQRHGQAPGSHHGQTRKGIWLPLEERYIRALRFKAALLNMSVAEFIKEFIELNLVEELRTVDAVLMEQRQWLFGPSVMKPEAFSRPPRKGD